VKWIFFIIIKTNKLKWPAQSLRPQGKFSNQDAVKHKVSLFNLGFKEKRISVCLDHAERQIWCNASVVFISKGPLDIALLQIDKVPIELNTIRPEFVCPTAGSSVYVVGHGRFVSEPMDDYEWLEKSIDTEVTHGVLPNDHDKKKALSASREDPMGQKGLFKIIILQNKPKKSMSSPVAPEGIDIFYLMD
jgi:hypothetical protein